MFHKVAGQQKTYGLSARREALDALWQQGVSGHALLKQHTEFIDHHIQKSFNDCEESGRGFALIALGGYGRKELFPFSDIDLMLLYERKVKKNLEKVADAVLYPLWDAGLEVGHAVRTVKNCLTDAKADFFFQVAMLDARLLAGSSSLFEELKDKYRRKFIEGHRIDFLREMLLYRAKRQTDFGNHTYLLEPHIKESRGGFRDYQAMLWTAQFIFGLHGLNDLHGAGILTAAEKQNLEEAHDYLVRIRNRLHYVSGRKNDQLYFEHQEEMAQAFGFKNDKSRLAVEYFMRQVYGHLQTIRVGTDLFFEHVNEVLDHEPRARDKKTLEPGIEVRHNRIHLSNTDLLATKPILLMRLFVQTAKTGIPIHHRTKKIISTHLDLITEKQRHSRRMANSFLALLKDSASPVPALAAMLETGMLAAYIPEFAKVESLAQHDIYHVYTVDRHLLQVIGELQKLREQERAVFRVVGSEHILMLAGLLHDIGKGFGSGHAERGADLARIIGGRFGLAETDLDDLAFLIRNHLFLSHTALRRDLEDEEFIMRCAEKIQSPERLAMLYLLTIADAKATGPSVWSDWKAALIQELYLKIALLLERSDLSKQDKNQGVRLGARWMRDKVSDQLSAADDMDIGQLPDDYLLNFAPEAVIEHIGHRKKLAAKDVLLFHEERQESWSLLMVTKDRPGLLAKIFGVLALHNLNVLAAQIFTWGDGTVVDTIEVKSSVSQNYRDQDWIRLEQDLEMAVNQRLGLEHRLHSKLAPLRKTMGGAEKRLDSKIEIDNKSSETYTIIEVYGHDRVGMLYEITRVLSDFGINIFRAMIGSRADQVVDVFYVLDYDGRKIKNPEFQNELKQGLLFAAADE
ncbi:MAG: [protein-PII] uridylyltransferase [Desulfobulbales bacterium]|nr:[protein-PII] uridylyltransferase [Desulfobulbales bacterium]